MYSRSLCYLCFCFYSVRLSLALFLFSSVNSYFLLVQVFPSLHFKVFFNYAWSRAFLFANDLPYIHTGRDTTMCMCLYINSSRTHTTDTHTRTAQTYTHSVQHTHTQTHTSSRQPQRRYLLNSLFFRVAFASFANFPHLLLFNCTEINAN